jgi:hypothetical protein
MFGLQRKREERPKMYGPHPLFVSSLNKLPRKRREVDLVNLFPEIPMYEFGFSF